MFFFLLTTPILAEDTPSVKNGMVRSSFFRVHSERQENTLSFPEENSIIAISEPSLFPLRTDEGQVFMMEVSSMALGFVRGPLDVRLLLLYILARVEYPIRESELLELALCDDAVNYFHFTEALSSLKRTGHILENENGDISITQKGRANGAVCEDELAYSVRLKCDRGTAELNRVLQRRNQIRGEILPRSDGNGVTVRLILDDDTGNLMTLDMLAPDAHQGMLLLEGFRARADSLYNMILSQLLQTQTQQHKRDNEEEKP